MADYVLVGLAVAAVLNLIVLIVLLLRRPADALYAMTEAATGAANTAAANTQSALAQALAQSAERLQRELRHELEAGASRGRGEITQTFSAFSQSLQTTTAEATRTQNAQIDAFAQQLSLLQKSLSDTLVVQLQSLGESNARRIQEVRGTLEQQLNLLQASNASKLDEMRQTVDEKLQSTLQARLGESFKLVADRLDQVHKGLGEMQTLATGVGDLKHLLSNVKTRGIFGEAQLAALLEQVLTVDQYAAQVATVPGSRNVVDFAVKLPGRGRAAGGLQASLLGVGQGSGDAPLWLPIDAKFPNEDYERLLDAQERADADGTAAAAKGLETRIRTEAKSMAEKYIAPPHTTDFAILFLPSEGLYAEVLRRPGLMDDLQRNHRVVLAGPTTLLAMLSSLQMGFRTLALEKRSSEVWQVLGAVKTEFAKFGDTLGKLRSQTEGVLKTLDGAQTRSNMMHRALKNVEALPQDQTAALLPSPADASDEADPSLQAAAGRASERAG